MSTFVLPESTRQRLTGLLFVSVSLYTAASIASFTLLPIVAAELSGSDSTAGIPSTVMLLGKAVSAYFIGRLMDRLGRRWGLSWGHGLGMLGTLLIVFSIGWGWFWGVTLGSLLLGMGRGAVDLGRFAAAEIYPISRRAKVIGLIVFAGTVGAIGGPALVGPSGRWVGNWGLSAATGPFVAATVLNLVGMVLLLLWLRPDPMGIGRSLTIAAENGEVAKAERPLRHIFRDSRVQLAIVAMVVGQLVMTTIMVITPLHMNHHNHSTEAISGVIMAHTLGMFGLSAVTGWLIDRFGRVVMIGIGAGVLVLAAVLTPSSTAVSMLATALFLLGLGWNFCFIAGSSLLADALQSNERGRVQGASDTLVSLASGVGSLGTGVVFDYWGITAVGGTGLFLAVALIGTTIWLARRQPGSMMTREVS